MKKKYFKEQTNFKQITYYKYIYIFFNIRATHIFISISLPIHKHKSDTRYDSSFFTLDFQLE